MEFGEPERRVWQFARTARLRGDCHAHTSWSDGKSPVEDMAAAARALGHEYLVITDHSPRLVIARGLSRERLLSQLDLIARLNEEISAAVAEAMAKRRALTERPV